MPTTPFSPTSLERLIVYVLKAAEREFGAIELAKVTYLIDVEKMRFLGETVTGEQYVREEKGPLVRGFSDSISRLVGHEVTVERMGPWGLNPWGKKCHSIGPDPRFEPSLPEVDRVIADRVLRRIEGLPPRGIEDLAYDTEPMKALLAREASEGMVTGRVLDFSTVQRDPRIGEWRANRKRKLSPDYLRFLDQERHEARDLVDSID